MHFRTKGDSSQITAYQVQELLGCPRRMRAAIPKMFGLDTNFERYRWRAVQVALGSKRRKNWTEFNEN